MSLINSTATKRVVYTRINTTLADWTAMLLDLCKAEDIDITNLRTIAIKHAWEGEDTPRSFATSLKLMQDRAARTALMKKIKAEHGEQ